jgi:hypothetical protein
MRLAPHASPRAGKDAELLTSPSNLPFLLFTLGSEVQSARALKNCTDGQSNFAFSCAMLGMEISRVTTGNNLARSIHGRAGIDLSLAEPRGPRRKRTRLGPSTACACLDARWRADPPAQRAPNGLEGSPPYDVCFRAWPTRFLRADHSSSNSQPRRLEPIATPRKQTTATRSNSQLWPFLVSAFRQRLLAPGPNSSFQPQASSFQSPDSNRPYGRLEINISPTKQRTEVLSNRSISGVFLSKTPAALHPGFGGPAGCQRYERQR